MTSIPRSTFVHTTLQKEKMSNALGSRQYDSKEIATPYPPPTGLPIHVFWNSVLKVTFEAIMAVPMKITVFWDVTPCSFVDLHVRFGGRCCVYLYPRNLHAYWLTIVPALPECGNKTSWRHVWKTVTIEQAPISSADQLFLSVQNQTCHFCVHHTHLNFTFP
jgi:hypothetical protein